MDEMDDVFGKIERITLNNDNRIVVLKINRPKKANAYNDALLLSLENELVKAIEDEHVRVILLTGEGNRAFCAGADLNEFGGKGVKDALHLKSREVFDLLATSPKLTIALINGAAIGGGLELALACDFRFAAPNATFAFPEVVLGLTPAAGGMRRIQPIIGKGRAKEMVLTGRSIDAAEAFNFGLVTYVGDDFVEHGTRYAEQIVEMNPLALELAKKNLDLDERDAQKELESVSQALLYELKKKK